MGLDISQRQCQEVTEAYGWDQRERGHSLLLEWLNSDTNFSLWLFPACGDSHMTCGLH